MRLERRLERLEARAAIRQREATADTVPDVWADIERLADWLRRLGSGEVSVEDAPLDVQETWRDMQRGATTGDLKGQADHRHASPARPPGAAVASRDGRAQAGALDPRHALAATRGVVLQNPRGTSWCSAAHGKQEATADTVPDVWADIERLRAQERAMEESRLPPGQMTFTPDPGYVEPKFQ
jgi:hypothetical protein